ncbi:MULTISPECIES: DNA-binding protein [Chromohalobacter]|uniref:DNA-binding protein n=1 Tax=Chromohalobacter beijerinckii TaxID=86179 RepID=A0ABV8XG07_9GAMM|nr:MULTISPECIES: DNA-binding protein [Chromohalobacter]MCK0753470.1 DNA-binding protein [Chromohalobacter japonicus]MCK0764844.1 DNA-binding protein [Chromohalobacter beijerinckii]CDQ34861.1 hypothetical protein BN993_04328 [Virgibacillus halodenitrificans]
MEETKAPQIPPFVPVMTIERFAQMSGLEEGVIQGHIRRGYLPTIKLGRYRVINLSLLQMQCLEEGDWS